MKLMQAEAEPETEIEAGWVGVWTCEPVELEDYKWTLLEPNLTGPNAIMR